MSLFQKSPLPIQTVQQEAPVKKGYIPPHLRKAQQEAEKHKPVDLNSLTSFPTLGSSPKPTLIKKPPHEPETNTLSYKTQIDKLIELEKMTQAEKAARLNSKKSMEGWCSLPLKISKERLQEIRKAQEDSEKACLEYELALCAGTQDLYSLEHPIPPTVQNDAPSEYLEISEEEEEEEDYE
jgi:hypothetical protein